MSLDEDLGDGTSIDAVGGGGEWRVNPLKRGFGIARYSTHPYC